VLGNGNGVIWNHPLFGLFPSSHIQDN